LKGREPPVRGLKREDGSLLDRDPQAVSGANVSGKGEASPHAGKDGWIPCPCIVPVLGMRRGEESMSAMVSLGTSAFAMGAHAASPFPPLSTQHGHGP
jgi:hypothetical protein